MCCYTHVIKLAQIKKHLYLFGIQVQYQKCLVTQTPPLRSKMWRAGSKVKRANSMDGSSFPPCHQGYAQSKMASSGIKKGMLAFFETFRNKPPVVPAP